MKKRILSCVLTFILAISMFNLGGCKKELVLVWDNYVESVDAFVNDIYYYPVPEVRDENGNDYEVFVDVTNAAGQEINCFGGFFLIEKPEQYSVNYTVDTGDDIFSKATKVTGLERTKYQLSNADLIYAVDDVIDLNGKVLSTIEGEIVYSVRNGENNIPLVDNKFTATETGVFTVDAKLGKQEAYSFDIYVVEKSERKYADGMILDGVSAQDLIATTSYDDFSASVSFDQTKKYDSASNGSYKIQAKTSGELQVANRSISFKIKPKYGSDYYKTLKENGYKYVAIRYMMETYDYNGTVRFDYISGSGNDEMCIYYDGSKVVEKSEAKNNTHYAFWQDNLDIVPRGAWAEMLLDIDKFVTTYYGDEINLFQLFVNKTSSLNVTMYIDNIYAVKDEAVSTYDTKIVDKGTQIDVTTLPVFSQVKNAINTYKFDGETISISDGKMKVDELGLYCVETTDRALYGSIKQNYAVKGSVVSRTPVNFSALHGNANGSVKNFLTTKNSDTGEITISSNGIGKVNENWQRTTYTIKPIADITYYQQLKAEGYKYITYEYTFNYGEYDMLAGTSVYRAALTKNKIPHYNSGGLNVDTAATHKYKFVDRADEGDTSTKTSNVYFQATSYPNELWKNQKVIISVSIDDFIKFYNAKGVNILTLYFSHAQPEMDYNVVLGRISPTVEACSF